MPVMAPTPSTTVTPTTTTPTTTTPTTPTTTPTVPFAGRADAGQALAHRLGRPESAPTVVLGVGAGGAVVAQQVAQAFAVPLDVVVVGHVARPFQPSLGLAAVAEDGVWVLDDAIANGMHIGLDRLASLERPVRSAVERRADRLRARHPARDLTGATVMVVADVVVSGLAARAAARVARRRGAERVVIAAPVVAVAAVPACRRVADDVVWVDCPAGLPDVRAWYPDLLGRDEIDVLDAAAADRAGRPG